MIKFDITKVEMYDLDEFTLYFSVECDKCKKASGQNIKGKFMTKMRVGCHDCNDFIGVDIIPEIEQTMKDKWNYDQDDVDAVMDKVKKFSKHDV